MKTCKCGKDMFVGNNYDGENDSIRTVWQCDSCDTMIETITDSKGVERFTVVDEGETENYTIAELVEEVNRDRSDEWVQYTELDVLSGWWEFVESDDIKLEVVTCESI